MNAPGPMSTRVRLLDGLVRIEDPDPALIPLQNKALDDLRAARNLGRKTDVEDALAVALELDALKLVL